MEHLNRLPTATEMRSKPGSEGGGERRREGKARGAREESGGDGRGRPDKCKDGEVEKEKGLGGWRKREREGGGR